MRALMVVALPDLNELAVYAKPAAVLVFALLWGWETLHPFFGRRDGRLRHAARNLGVALFNTVVIAVAFGTVTVLVAVWAAENRLGLLRLFDFPWPVRLALAVVVLDAWMYVWHRLNHHVPLLWRFHRMHHSDDRMDVTTATRFHMGELAASAMLRMGLVLLVGFEVTHLLVYDTLLLAVTMFHHADISLGRWDRPLRWLIVTPFMHKVHHSRWRPETDSNYSSLFSFWDRLARTFRMRRDPATVSFGLDEFDDPRWQTFAGMLKTPFTDPEPVGPPVSRLPNRPRRRQPAPAR